MAKALNKHRILASKIILISSLMLVFISKQFWPDDSIWHEVFEMLGLALVFICAMGRVYATAYLGGFKNEELVTHGIYSIMRNPLYFFTLLGVTGIGLISNHIVIMIALPVTFLLLYSGLIKREESFLEETFGDEYRRYKQKVPALFPNFKNYQAPQTLTFYPHFMNNAFFDAVWWVMALPIIELTEYLQINGILPTFFVS